MTQKFLWHIYKATTNSPNDTWKIRHLASHPNANEKLLGKAKPRYTIPILGLGKTKDGENLLLLVQTSLAELDWERFAIKSEAFTKRIGAKVEWIYPFNVRVGTQSEFYKDGGRFRTYGSIKELFRDEIMNKSMRLIQGTPRIKIIKDIRDNKFSNFNQREWNHLIVKDQFSSSENRYRGFKKRRK